jgi:hypothetical protein
MLSDRSNCRRFASFPIDRHLRFRSVSFESVNFESVNFEESENFESDVREELRLLTEDTDAEEDRERFGAEKKNNILNILKKKKILKGKKWWLTIKKLSEVKTNN